MSNPVRVEYRIRPVTRYLLTKYEATENTGGSEQVGEYDNPDVAYAVGYALCKQRHELLGWPLDDTRIKYPDHPSDPNKIAEEYSAGIVEANRRNEARAFGTNSRYEGII